MADFVSKVNTFLTTSGGGNPGWNADRHVAGSGQWAVSKDDGGGNSVEVAFQWDTSSPNALGVYQYRSGSGAGNYNTGAAPYAQANDSGNGAQSTSDASLVADRHVPITNTPIQYWAFAGDTYAHVVVQTTALLYVHFGFGVLDKFNDWDGGEYCYGWKYGLTTGVAMGSGSSMLLDGLVNGSGLELFAATIHCANLANQPTNGLYAVHMGNQGSGSLGNDRQGTPRGRAHFSMGYRAGSHAVGFGQFPGTIIAGHIPTYPIVTYHWNRTSDGIAPVGAMKDVRGIMLRNFLPGDTVTIGSDTWYVFPSGSRWTSGSFNGTTGYQGIMYKRN
jgi:hypothetical protein